MSGCGSLQGPAPCSVRAGPSHFSPGALLGLCSLPLSSGCLPPDEKPAGLRVPAPSPQCVQGLRGNGEVSVSDMYWRVHVFALYPFQHPAFGSFLMAGVLTLSLAVSCRNTSQCVAFLSSFLHFSCFCFGHRKNGHRKNQVFPDWFLALGALLYFEITHILTKRTFFF